MKKSRNQRATVIGTVSAAAMLLLSACGGESGAQPADTSNIRFANVLPPDDAISETIDHWMDDVTDRTDGAVDFTHNYSGALVSGAEMHAGLGDGRADAGMLTPGYHPAEMPLSNIAQVPVPYDSQTRALALQKLFQENETVNAEFAEAGMVPFFVTLVASPWAYATKEPVTSLEDLDGQRIRLLPNAAPAYEAFGVQSVSISSDEIYESIQRGVIDGASQPFDTWHSTSVYEVAPHVVDTGIGAYGAGVIVMNAETYESLAPEQQQALEEAAESSYEVSAAIFAEREAAACEDIREAGGTVTQLSEEERAEFQSVAEDLLVELWYESAENSGHDRAVLEDIWNEYSQYLEEFEADSTYESGLLSCAE